jgi:hypothetical protein
VVRVINEGVEVLPTGACAMGEPVELAAAVPGDDAYFANLIWTADAEHVLFTADDALWVIDLEDGGWRPRELQQYVRTDGLIRAPVGGRIAFTSGQGDEVLMVTDDGLSQGFAIDTLRAPGYLVASVFSPDGLRLAYVIDDYDGDVGGYELRVADVSEPGSPLRLGSYRSTDQSSLGNLMWSSDGSALAFSGADLYVLEVGEEAITQPRLLGGASDNIRDLMAWEP